MEEDVLFESDRTILMGRICPYLRQGPPILLPLSSYESSMSSPSDKRLQSGSFQRTKEVS